MDHEFSQYQNIESTHLHVRDQNHYKKHYQPMQLKQIGHVNVQQRLTMQPIPSAVYIHNIRSQKLNHRYSHSVPVNNFQQSEPHQDNHRQDVPPLPQRRCVYYQSPNCHPPLQMYNYNCSGQVEVDGPPCCYELEQQGCYWSNPNGNNHHRRSLSVCLPSGNLQL